MRAARGTLIAVGLAGLAMGGFVLLTEVAPSRYLGIAVWVGAAILLHDGVVAPLVVAAGLGTSRLAGRVSRRRTAVAQGALLVGAVLTVIATPAIISSTLGNPNDTILVGAYGISLAAVWAIVLVVAFVALRPPAARPVASGTARTK